jgi:hypothetical protein
MNYHLLIIGSAIAIVYTYLFLPNCEGKSAGSKKLTFYPFMHEGKIVIPITNNEVLHIHHWLIYLFLALIIPHYIFFGFAITMVFQGLAYRDCFNFVEKRPMDY